jgi:hypothetical protein
MHPQFSSCERFCKQENYVRPDLLLTFGDFGLAEVTIREGKGDQGKIPAMADALANQMRANGLRNPLAPESFGGEPREYIPSGNNYSTGSSTNPSIWDHPIWDNEEKRVSTTVLGRATPSLSPSVRDDGCHRHLQKHY